VDGKIVMENRIVKTLKEEEILEETEKIIWRLIRESDTMELVNKGEFLFN
jgi:hypothetical protein